MIHQMNESFGMSRTLNLDFQKSRLDIFLKFYKVQELFRSKVQKSNFRFDFRSNFQSKAARVEHQQGGLPVH